MAETSNLNTLNQTSLKTLHWKTKNQLLIRLKEFSLECYEDVRKFNTALGTINVAKFEGVKASIDKLVADQTDSFNKLKSKISEINASLANKPDVEDEATGSADGTEALKQKIERLKKKMKS